jgi:ketosteroid isomerase-like protein
VSHVDHIRSYYEALNTGDAEAVSAHFTEDAVHYYTRLGPHESAKTIGDYAALGVQTIDAQWYIENADRAGRPGGHRVDDDVAGAEVRR